MMAKLSTPKSGSTPVEPTSAGDGGPLALQLDRRRFLRYVGTGAATIVGATQLLPLAGCRPAGAPEPPSGSWTGAQGVPRWVSPPYPVPLPGEGSGAGIDTFRHYRVHDDLVLPEGWSYRVVAQWGDRFGPADDPERQITFGYNNDYTGLVPIAGSEDEYWLLVNHEYVTLRPFLAALREDGIEDLAEMDLRADPEQPWHKYGIFTLQGFEMEGSRVSLAPGGPGPEVPDEAREAMRRLSDQGLQTLGVSVLRVRRTADGGFEVVQDAPDHRRIETQGSQNIALDSDGRPPFAFTGPAQSLMPPPPGTFCNCSGGTTPWGTFLTCEENYQYQAEEEVSPAGTLLPNTNRCGSTAWWTTPTAPP